MYVYRGRAAAAFTAVDDFLATVPRADGDTQSLILTDANGVIAGFTGNVLTAEQVGMPDGANRFYLDNPDIGEYYGAYVGEELVEITRRMFPLSRERKDTAIGGLSMGGFGAIRNGLFYADTFGSIIGLSSALITEEVAAMPA